jgi:putative tricarboxylic transport membrane protein
MPEPSERRGIDVAALVVAAFLLILALIVFQNAFSLTLEATYGIGPRAMPYVVGTALVLLTIAHVVLAFTGGVPKPAAPIDPQAMGWLTAGLVGLIACIGLGVGFIPAMMILFATTARAMGRRAFAIDLAIGFVLGLIVYLLFTKLLALGLPEGPLERLI